MATTLTVGSGGTYATWQLARAALPATLDDDYILRQVGAIVETAAASVSTIAMNGYDITVESSSPHGGDPTAGLATTMNTDGATNVTPLWFALSGSGNLEISGLRYVSIGTPGGGSSERAISLQSCTNTKCQVHDIIVLGSLACDNAMSMVNCTNLEIWNFEAEGCENNGLLSVTCSGKIENCTLVDCGDGFDGSNNSTFFMLNVVCINNTTSWDFTGTNLCTGFNLASSDITAFGTTPYRNIVPATEFESLSSAASNYLKVTDAGVCGAGGRSVLIVDNDFGIRGNARPDFGNWSVGADELDIVPPTVTSVSPDNGAESGGTSVSVFGTLFVDGATVTFDGNPATSVSFVGAGQIDCDTPAGTGVVDVVVTNPDGGFGTLVGGYTYNPAPTVTSVDPNNGALAGGTSVSVFGTEFVDGATVTFDGNPATGVSFVDSGQIDCNTPAGTGTVDVVVTNPDTQDGTLVGGYTYNPLPTVTSVNPNSGVDAGGTSVSVFGTNFIDGATVTFDGNPATGVSFVDSGQIDCNTPAGTGVVDVVVTNPDTQDGTLVGGYTYVDPTPPQSSGSGGGISGAITAAMAMGY